MAVRPIGQYNEWACAWTKLVEYGLADRIDFHLHIAQETVHPLDAMLGLNRSHHSPAQSQHPTALHPHRTTDDSGQRLHTREAHSLDIVRHPCQNVVRVVHRFSLQSGLVFSTCDHFRPEKTCTAFFYAPIPKLGIVENRC